MKSNCYTFQEMYSLIRSHYIINFPHAVEFNALDVLNLAVTRFNTDSIIKMIGSDYVFENPIPTQRDEVYNTNDYAIALENYYSQTENIVNLFRDVNAFHLWLVKESYIKSGIATEKMLAKKDI